VCCYPVARLWMLMSLECFNMLLGCYYVDVKVFRVFSTCYYAVAKVVAIWLLRSLECFNMLLCSCKCIL